MTNGPERAPGGDVVAVFARVPRAGAVKTRLAAAVGDAAAADLYAAFVADLAAALPDPRWALRWWIAPPAEGFAARFGLDPAACRVQRGDDLGQRMRGAIAASLAEGFARCVLVGSDAPRIGPPRIAEAFAALGGAGADLVLGPAEDGGFYLVGMGAPLDTFAGVPWSSPRTLAETLRRAASLGLRTALLAPEADVDDGAGLARLRRSLARPGGLPATRAALARLDGRG